LVGGAGDDQYRVDQGNDAVVELAGGGTDTVFSAVSFSLAADVENLALTGVAAVNGNGNGLGNVLTGNGAANALWGQGGDDTLQGGAGADTLDGGAGRDSFRYGSAAEGGDTIRAFSAADDTVEVSAAGFGGAGAGRFGDRTVGGGRFCHRNCRPVPLHPVERAAFLGCGRHGCGGAVLLATFAAALR
jgi:Ca2+-binding RTX toxin-like protein